MWGRVVEAMLGVWLAVSPFVFQHPASATMQWTVDFGAATLTIALALASYWRPLEYLHFGTLLVALGLLVWAGWPSQAPPTPATQNNIIIGLLLAMMALVPNEASLPPRRWREFLERGHS